MSSRLKSVDCLRGAAALGVVLSHALTYVQAPPRELDFIRQLALPAILGGFGVPLFFVISGFCIHARWAQSLTQGVTRSPDFAAFWRRRFWRLYPPYLAALTLSMGLVLAAFLLGRSDLPLVRLYPEPKPLWMGLDFALHAVMLHGFHPVFDQAGGNPPFWTLAREEYLYLLYFVLLAWRRRWGSTWSTLITFGIGLGLHALARQTLPAASSWYQLISSSALTLWFQWSLGMIAVEAYTGVVQLPRWCKAPALIPLWAVLAIQSYRFAPLLVPAFWGLACFTLVNVCVEREQQGRWRGGGVTALITRVGVFSYSLYLVHNPIRAVVKQLVGPWFPDNAVWGYAMMVAIIVTAGVLAGLVFFHLIERHFLFGRAAIKRG